MRPWRAALVFGAPVVMLTLLLAVVAPPARASATLRLEPASGRPGTSFEATYALDEESCAAAEERSATFVWDYGTSAARTLGSASVSRRSCKAGLETAVPSDATGGNHTVGAYVDGVDESTATAGFTVDAAATTTTTATTTPTTATTSAPSSSTTNPSPPGAPPPPASTPTTAPTDDVPTDAAVPSEDQQTEGSSSSSTSTSARPASSTSERDPSTTTTEKVGVAFATIGCPRPGEAVAAATAGGFPIAGVTLGGTALGGAVLAGILVARRRTAMAAAAAVLAAAALVAASPLPSTAQSGPEDDSGAPIAFATISGIPGRMSVLDIEPPVDLKSTTQRVLTSPWTITKPLDDASPALVEAVTTGDVLRCVEFQFTDDNDGDGGGEPRAIFALAGVRVGRVEHRATAASGATPTEEVDFHYSRLAYRYRPVTNDGSLGPTVEGVLP